MGLIGTAVWAIICATGLVCIAACGRLVADEYKQWSPKLVEIVLRMAVARLPEDKRERMHEEWSAHLTQIPGDLSKAWTAIGFWRAARLIGPYAGVAIRIGAGFWFLSIAVLRAICEHFDKLRHKSEAKQQLQIEDFLSTYAQYIRDRTSHVPDASVDLKKPQKGYREESSRAFLNSKTAFQRGLLDVAIGREKVAAEVDFWPAFRQNILRLAELTCASIAAWRAARKVTRMTRSLLRLFSDDARKSSKK